MGQYKVTNKNLLKEVLIVQATGKMSDELWLMFNHMAKKIEYKYNNRADDKGDVIHHAVIDAVTNVRKFDIERGENAFAYFTSVLSMGIVRGYKQLYWNKYDYRFESEIPLFSDNFFTEE